MNKQYILFDLDGTIIDSRQVTINAVRHALKKFDMEEPNEAIIETFIGPPLSDSFQGHYKLEGQQLQEAIDTYREYYRLRGMEEVTLYDGIADTLKTLKEAGKTIAMATSKPMVFGEQIAKNLKIDSCFNLIVGSELDGRRTGKKEIIQYVIDHLHIKDKEEMVMIGDRKFDVLGAKEQNIDSIAVSYGFGSMNELISCQPTRIAKTAIEIKEILGV